MSGGWFKQQRNLTERAWTKEANLVQLYIFLKEMAYVSDSHYKGCFVRRGSCPTTRSELAEITGQSLKTIDRNLKKLVSYGEIIVRGNSRFSVITICDYDTYGVQDDLFGTSGDTDSDTGNDTSGDTGRDTSGDTTLYIKEERIKDNNNILVSPYSPYKKERERGDFILELKKRYNKIFDGKLPPLIRLTLPTRLCVEECVRRFGKQSVDAVFEQIQKEPFMLGENKSGFRANFQFIFTPTNFQQYLERAQLRKSRAQIQETRPQQPKGVGVINVEPTQPKKSAIEERRRNVMELVDYIRENPQSANYSVLEELYRNGELQRLGIDWAPTR